MNLKVDNKTNFGKNYHISIAGSDKRTIEKAAGFINKITNSDVVVNKSSEFESYFLNRAQNFFVNLRADLTRGEEIVLKKSFEDLPGDKYYSFTEIA